MPNLQPRSSRKTAARRAGIVLVSLIIFGGLLLAIEPIRHKILPQDEQHHLRLDFFQEGENETYVPIQTQDLETYPLLGRLFAELEPNENGESIRVRDREVSEARKMIQELAARKPEAPHTQETVAVTWQGSSFRLSVGAYIS